MNKYSAGAVSMVTLLVFLSGCLCGDASQTGASGGSPESGGASQTTATQPRAVREGGQAVGQPAVTTTQKVSAGLVDRITDLASAMSSGVSYKCRYTYAGVTSESWVKGQKFYSTSTVNGVASNMVSDGTWMYTWAEGETEGVKFNIAQMKSAGGAGGGGYTDINQVANTAANVDCRPDVSADSKFRPPSGVEFQDMGELLKQYQKMGAGV